MTLVCYEACLFIMYAG